MSRYRFLQDPLYHAAVELIARTAVEAVELADKHPDPNATPSQHRLLAVIGALVDGPVDSQAVVDVAVSRYLRPGDDE